MNALDREDIVLPRNSYVFIAGPYMAKGGGHDAAHWYEIDKHINEARLWATKLAQVGIAFFCPHMNSAHMEVLAPNALPEFWYEMDNQILKHASALLLLPGWGDSTGAVAESRLAEELGIPVFDWSTYGELVVYWATNASIER